MQFSRNGTVPQLYVATDNGNATPGTLLYLLPQDTTSPPSEITFSDSWANHAGTYIFLEQPFASGTEAAFAAAAWAYLADPRMQGTRFAWFNPLNASGILTGTTLAVYQPPGGNGFATAFAVTFAFQSVSLFIAANTPVAPDDINFAFTFTQQGLRSIYLTAAWGTLAIDTVGSTVTLPFTGSLAGCLQFALQLTEQNQTDLDVGFRYFYAVPPDSSKPGNPAADFFLASLRYPIFNQFLTLYANLDPLAALNAARTFFAFNGADAGQPSGGAAAPLASYFNSTMGDSFNLLPLTGSAAPTSFAALVFSTNQQASAPSAHDPFYIVPKGDFALQTSRSGTVDLMCGLSGVEYFELEEETNIISFFPGQAAFAAGFFPSQPPGYTSLQPSVIPTTSLASVTAVSSPLDYFAQPEQSVLYNYNTESVPGVTTMPALAVVAVQSATVNWPPVSSLAFPLFPYSGLGGQNLEAYQQMESQSVSTARRLVLAKAPPKARALTASAEPQQQSKYSTTPQGLLATYVPGSSSTTWDEIILAQMALPVASPEQLALTNVQGNLLSAFQSNKLFLVVTDAATIQDSLLAQNAQIIIGTDPSETWQFNLDPAQWAEFGTIFIIKFYNMSINDLAGQTSTWASGDYFNNNNAATISATIKNIIASTDPNDSDFAAFINAVNNPNWSGILILNAMAPLQELPSELAGLAAGIDPSLFFAHHVGINASLINIPADQSNPLSISNSSIFGLINYNAPAPLKMSSSDYQFQVEQLKVLFLNSAVAGFSSVIDLQINKLFGEMATLEGSSNNIVKMYGVYQKHVVNGQTLESYLFQTQSGQSSIFDMTSSVLNALLISQGQFVTVYPVPLTIAASGAVRASGTTTVTTTTPHGLAAGDTVDINGVTDTSFNGQFAIVSVPSPTTFTYAQASQSDSNGGNGTARATETVSQFIFWGLLDFKALANFDLFSFGRATWQVAAPSDGGAARASGTTTITTITPHGFTAGSPVAVAGVSDSSFNGQFSVATVPTPTTLTYAQAGKADSKSGGGTVAVPTPAGLKFDNLIIDMTYDSASSQPAQFTFDASQLSFDLADSFTRLDSFFRHFPLTVGGFTQAKDGTTPAGQGFMSLQTPLSQSSLVYPWYSLNFNLNLGSPGALAAQVGFVATLAAAWAPSSDEDSSYKVFAGLQLPGSSGSKQAISIEGLFNITFKTLEIIVIPDSNTYILVLYNIGFKFLSFTFPPTGQVNFVLFGDPGSTTTSDTSLGWYAAYAKPATNGSGGTGGTGGTSKSGLIAQPKASLISIREE